MVLPWALSLAFQGEASLRLPIFEFLSESKYRQKNCDLSKYFKYFFLFDATCNYKNKNKRFLTFAYIRYICTINIHKIYSMTTRNNLFQ